MLLKGLSFNLITYNIFVSCLCELCNWEEASKLLQNMVHDGIVPDQITYTSIIHAHLVSGHLRIGILVFCDMLNKGVFGCHLYSIDSCTCGKGDSRTAIYVFLRDTR